MQFLWKYIDDLAGKGLQIQILGELMFYVSASLVPLALPLAMLLASLMTMGNLGENFELTALKASGISLPRIVAPLVILSFFLTIGAFLFANYILPITNLKMGALLYDITNQRPELQIREGVFYNGIDDFSIRIARRNYRTNMMYNIRIYDHSQRSGMRSYENVQSGNVSVTVADSGFIKMTSDKKFLIITLFSGYNYSEAANTGKKRRYGENTYPFRRDKFKKQEIIKELVGFGLNRTDENLFRQNYRMLSLKQLEYFTDSFKIALDQKANRLHTELKPGLLLRYQPGRYYSRGYIDSAERARLKRDSLRRLPFDSVYTQLDVHEKSTIANQALSYARDVKTFISSNAINADDEARRMRRYDIEWWKKLTLSVSCLIFFLIGAPLGAIIRKGGLGMPVVISVLFFVLWYIISLSSEKIVREGILPGYIGMWIASIILFITGIFLVRKATLDSSMFNIDTYLNPVKKFGARFFKIRNASAE
jgi:lipopolysaccharide export system permease protein